MNSRLPRVGDRVTTADGLKGEVSGVNVLRQTVKVVVNTGDEKESREYPVGDLKFRNRRRKDHDRGGKEERKKGSSSADKREMPQAEE